MGAGLESLCLTKMSIFVYLGFFGSENVFKLKKRKRLFLFLYDLQDIFPLFVAAFAGVGHGRESSNHGHSSGRGQCEATN
jgi:hypothetical protein